MTLETAILLVQTLVTASIAGWLFLGVMDNYLTPSLNGGFARSVLTFERLKEMYPDDFARVQYREIKSPALHKTVFVVIVVSETLVCLGLFVGVYMMGRALLGLEDPEAARVVALRRISAGDSVGYGAEWTATDDTTIATLPVGYADGIPRAVLGRGEVHLAGARRPIVGRVSMDSVCVDVGDAAVEVGDRTDQS